MSGLCWSPDGRYLSFLFVESETEEERKRRERGEDARVWDTDYRYRRLWLVEVATREARVASPAGLQVWGYAWAPDAQRIALAVSLSPKVDDLFRETSVGELRIDTGTYRDLFRVRGLAENLVWSANGEWLAYRGPAGRVVHGEHVFRRHVETGVVECLTPDYGGTVEWLGASRGGEELVIVAYEGLDARVFRLGWEGERALLCPRVGGTWHGGVIGSRDGRIWARVWSDVEHVSNVWGWDTGGEYDISHSDPQTLLHPPPRNPSQPLPRPSSRVGERSRSHRTRTSPYTQQLRWHLPLTTRRTNPRRSHKSMDKRIPRLLARLGTTTGPVGLRCSPP